MYKCIWLKKQFLNLGTICNITCLGIHKGKSKIFCEGKYWTDKINETKMQLQNWKKRKIDIIWISCCYQILMSP
jgi:hypothetical protein